MPEYKDTEGKVNTPYVEEGEYPVEYVNKDEFPTFVKSHGIGTNAQLVVCGGFYRWLITKEDGTKVIVQPK